MEKNTVIMDLESYTNLVMENHKMQEELKELKEEIVPSYLKEVIELDKQIRQLIDVVIEYAINDFNLEYYELERITNIHDYRFAISEERREQLHSLGITKEEMIRVITERKERYEATKDEGEE